MTIVLPVHNMERTLRAITGRILELTEIAARRLSLVVVDDGSTDGTYEVACELARQFPQVSVLRQPHRRGLGAALDQLRRRIGAEQVVAHDGVTPVDFEELAGLLSESMDARSILSKSIVKDPADEGRGSRRFAAVSALNARLAEAHHSVASFRWLRLDEPLAPRRARLGLAPLEIAPSDLLPSLDSSANTFIATMAVAAP